MNYDKLKTEKFSFVYLSQDQCSVCNVTQPILEKLASKYKGATFTRIDLNVNEYAKGYFSVFTIPAILVYSEGKELLREARFFNFKEIEERLDRNYEMIFDVKIIPLNTHKNDI